MKKILFSKVALIIYAVLCVIVYFFTVRTAEPIALIALILNVLCVGNT